MPCNIEWSGVTLKHHKGVAPIFALLATFALFESPTFALAQSQTRSEPMAQTNQAADEAQIRSLIDKWVEAFHIKSVDAVMALHAPGIVSFDIVPPLRYIGEDFREPWAAVFAMTDGPINVETRDLSVTTGTDIAFSHSLIRFRGAMKDGKKADYWFRWTACFRKMDGKWLIVHDHTSLPTDFVNGQARQDLEP